MAQSASREVHCGGNTFLILAAFVQEIQGDIASQILRKIAAFGRELRAAKYLALFARGQRWENN